MCVGLVISWSKLSLARNLGKGSFKNMSKLYILMPRLAHKNSRLMIPAKVILLSQEAVVDVANQ